MKIQSSATNPGKMLHIASPTPLAHCTSRTIDTGYRGDICSKFNVIPHFFPTSQIVNGKEVYVSGSSKDSTYRIYTIESNNWLKQFYAIVFPIILNFRKEKHSVIQWYSFLKKKKENNNFNLSPWKWWQFSFFFLRWTSPHHNLKPQKETNSLQEILHLFHLPSHFFIPSPWQGHKLI